MCRYYNAGRLPLDNRRNVEFGISLCTLIFIMISICGGIFEAEFWLTVILLSSYLIILLRCCVYIYRPLLDPLLSSFPLVDAFLLVFNCCEFTLSFVLLNFQAECWSVLLCVDKMRFNYGGCNIHSAGVKCSKYTHINNENDNAQDIHHSPYGIKIKCVLRFYFCSTYFF